MSTKLNDLTQHQRSINSQDSVISALRVILIDLYFQSEAEKDGDCNESSTMQIGKNIHLETLREDFWSCPLFLSEVHHL